MTPAIPSKTTLSLAQALVGLIWWGTWLAIAAAALVLILNTGRGDDSWSISGPLNVEVYSIALRSETGAESSIERSIRSEPFVAPLEGDSRIRWAEFDDLSARFRVRPSLGYGLVVFGPILLLVFVSVWGTYLLRSLLISVNRGEVFSIANADRIRYIGAMIVGGAIALPFLEWAQFRAIAAAVEMRGVRFDLSLPDLEILALGFVTLTLAEVWRYGIRLQADRDLTV